MEVPTTCHHICQTAIITCLHCYESSPAGVCTSADIPLSGLNWAVILWEVPVHAAPLFKAFQTICSSFEVNAKAFQELTGPHKWPSCYHFPERPSWAVPLTHSFPATLASLFLQSVWHSLSSWLCCFCSLGLTEYPAEHCYSLYIRWIKEKESWAS